MKTRILLSSRNGGDDNVIINDDGFDNCFWDKKEVKDDWSILKVAYLWGLCPYFDINFMM